MVIRFRVVRSGTASGVGADHGHSISASSIYVGYDTVQWGHDGLARTGPILRSIAVIFFLSFVHFSEFAFSESGICMKVIFMCILTNLHSAGRK